MSFLILSILLNAALFMLFKIFDNKGGHLLSIVIGNYIACIIAGIMNAPIGSFSAYSIFVSSSHIILGFLFFGVFYLMGQSSIKIGIGITGAAAKMSLLLTVVLLSVYSHESFKISGILALLMALTALFMMSATNNENWQLKSIVMPIAIFIGSALIDTFLAILKEYQIKKGLDQAPGIVFIFSGALILAITLSLSASKDLRFKIRFLPHGLFLGFINYYSIHFLLNAIENRKTMTLNILYMLNNMGIVIVTFFIGLLIFKEKLSLIKVAGLLLALFSIYLILKN